jgi:hypothetical protein
MTPEVASTVLRRPQILTTFEGNILENMKPYSKQSWAYVGLIYEKTKG